MCPNCDKNSLCSCKSCADRRKSGERPTPTDMLVQIVLDPMNGQIQCPYCNHIYMWYEEEERSWEAYTKSDQYRKERGLPLIQNE